MQLVRPYTFTQPLFAIRTPAENRTQITALGERCSIH